MAYNLNQQKASGHGVIAKIKRFFFGAHQDKLTALQKIKEEERKMLSKFEEHQRKMLSWCMIHSRPSFQKRRRVATIAHISRMRNYLNG